ncbi:antibiotic biosynthesis monooxygenase [Herbiconiux moechotypicola]|uniref:Antibiotic biosynthesis monooxygenase n=1 Tax=Herbiconiux moechotypicola TaxID=637393 RepID=A0ABN3E5T0_9MICO|nr:antibiotic biosynthesis monooxygenase [Herbiconiux moechotypicola]MCS5731952.1 antibiotic biosynthesis monooxygenase [Herbiconiux moechotypicola]
MTSTAGAPPALGQVPGAVSLVVHRRLAESSYAKYAAWQEKVGARISNWPGYLDRQVIPPKPPLQVDWVIVQRFRDVESARGWLQSAERARLMNEIKGEFVGNDDVHLFTEEAKHPSEAASVLISSRVPADQEEEFLDWQRQIMAAESRFDGFLGHKIERPVPGVQDDWVVVLSFDTEEHLNAWIDSPERRELLDEGKAYNEQLTLTKASYGFGFWTGNRTALPDPIFKSNLLVLLMLYPIVFLWGYFIADPLLANHGVPFWLSLFIGNVVSTQLLGWILVPWAFKLFGWWVKRDRPPRVHFYGYAIVVALYAVSIAVYAWLISLGPVWYS